MTFQIVIFIFGAILFLVGLVGKIDIREFGIGTHQPRVRWAAFVLGVGFIGISFMIAGSDSKETLTKIETLNATITQYEETIQGLQQSLEETSHEKQQSEQVLDDHKRKLTQCQTSMSEADTKYQVLYTQCDSLDTSLTESQDHVNDLQQQKGSLERQIIALGEQIR